MVDNILLDLSAVRRGGGVQLAANFLEKYTDSDFLNFKLLILLPGDGDLATCNLSHKVGIIEIVNAPVGLLKRQFFYRRTLKRLIRQHNIKAVFTFFGSGVPCPGHVINVVSVAYPIICYPDSPFWNHLPFGKSLSVRFINMLRRYSIRRATMVLAETNVMKNRLIKHVGICPENVHVIPPVVSSYLEDTDTVTSSCKRMLVLSGLAPHKNLWRLYDIAHLLDAQRINVKFVLSVDKNAFFSCQKNKYPFNKSIQENYFEFVGHVPPWEIGQLYEQSDALLNISDLESFSNNYMEAWKSARPMICSDRDFAREICGGSAIYVEPHDCLSVVNGVKRLCSVSSDERKAMVDEGLKRLAQLPDFSGRFNEIAKLIDSRVNPLA